MNKQWVNLGLILLLGIVGFLIFQKKVKQVEKIHYHAGFQVYIDDKLQDFSAPKYMHIKPCGDETHPSREEEQLEKAHLHSGIGNIVHVHRAGATWVDLFTNLKYKFKEQAGIKGYINGKRVDKILKYPIKSYDSVIIFTGKFDEKLLEKAVKKAEIIRAEKNTESC